MKLEKSLLPCDEITLRASLEKFKQELAEHSSTVGVPAPWPDYDILRVIVAAGGEFEVNDVAKQEMFKRNGQAFIDRRARLAGSQSLKPHFYRSSSEPENTVRPGLQPLKAGSTSGTPSAGSS